MPAETERHTRAGRHRFRFVGKFGGSGSKMVPVQMVRRARA